MAIETKEKSIKLVEAMGDGVWVVRWNFKPVLDENGNETEINSYEEESYNWIPNIEDIQRTITEWHNKQTDGLIRYGFEWKGIRVLLSDENKFNFSLFAIEAERRENAIKKWDEENPELAGINSIKKEVILEDGTKEVILMPTGRPSSRIPITFKLSDNNEENSFYTFETLDELFEFTSASADHLQSAYAAGWYKIATFDWIPYVQALNEL